MIYRYCIHLNSNEKKKKNKKNKCISHPDPTCISWAYYNNAHFYIIPYICLSLTITLWDK